MLVENAMVAQNALILADIKVEGEADAVVIDLTAEEAARPGVLGRVAGEGRHVRRQHLGRLPRDPRPGGPRHERQRAGPGGAPDLAARQGSPSRQALERSDERSAPSNRSSISECATRFSASRRITRV